MRSPFRFGHSASLVVLMSLLAAGCSDSGPDADADSGTQPSSADASTPAQPDTGYPDSIAAIGHSGITGESSHEQRFRGSGRIPGQRGPLRR